MECAISIGNSNVTISIRSLEKEIISIKKINIESFFNIKITEDVLKDYFHKKQGLIKTIIILSVVPTVNKNVKKAIYDILKISPVFIDYNFIEKTGFDFSNYSKEQVGIDRLLVSFLASQTSLVPCVVIDFGTAISFNVISSSKAFLGGIILPSPYISKLALIEKTNIPNENFLKDYEETTNDNFIGTNTKECIHIGVVKGTAILVDKFIEHINESINEKLKVIIATGGGAKNILPYCTNEIKYNEFYLLRAIYKIYDVNKIENRRVCYAKI